MNKVWTENAWQDYIYWQTEDRKTLKKINRLIEDVSRNGNNGIGKPEPLVGELSGFWSRRIDETNRLVYKSDASNIYILSCRYHCHILRAGEKTNEISLKSFKIIDKMCEMEYNIYIIKEKEG